MIWFVNMIFDQSSFDQNLRILFCKIMQEKVNLLTQFSAWRKKEISISATYK